MGGLNLKKQIGLRFDERFLKVIDKYAAKKKMNRTEFIENAIKLSIAREIKRERALEKAE